MATYRTAHGMHEIPEVGLIETSIGKMAVRDTHGTGQTVVAVHGWGVDSVLNFGQCLGAGGDARMIAVDLPGHGESERRVPFTIDSTADAVAEILEILRTGPVVAIGYSLGGAVIQSLLERHGDLVQKTVYVATAARFGDRARWAVPVLAGTLRAGSYLPHLRFAKEREGYTSTRHLMHLIGTNDPRALAEAIESGAKHDGGTYRRLESVESVSIITRRDRIIPAEDQRTLAALSGGRITEIDAGHDACFDPGFAAVITGAVAGEGRVGTRGGT